MAVADRVARTLIAAGGLGTIAAVLTVCVFLVWVVAPLFLPASLGEPVAHDSQLGSPPPWGLGVDEYQRLAWALRPDGSFVLARLDNGTPLRPAESLVGRNVTAAAFSGAGGRAGFGYADGTVRIGEVGIRSEFLTADQVSRQLQLLAAGQIAAQGDGLVERTSTGQFRAQRLAVRLAEPIELPAAAPVRLLDVAPSDLGHLFCALTADGRLRLEGVTQQENLLTGEIKYHVRTAELPLAAAKAAALPDFLLLTGAGAGVDVAWRDGRLVRFDARDWSNPQLVEDVDLVPEAGESLTVLTFMIGRTTIAAGDTLGRVRGWFLTKPADAATADGNVLTMAHELGGPGAPVTAIAASSRTRMLAAGYGNGRVRAYNLTNDRLLVETEIDGRAPVVAVCLAPKDDGLVAVTDRRVVRWELQPRHPEVTIGSLFGKVWYEGYAGPEHVWQSSSGSDDFEPKFGLAPLIFGTLKATVYSLLFAAPLALLAAIYSSEYLRPRAKALVKPAIELMASLPSVVLGFLAGLVIAPLAENVVPTILACVYVVPLAVLVGAYLWQLLPRSTALRLDCWKLGLMALALPLGLLAAALVAPALERGLFQGDLRLWLTGQTGRALGGWVVLLLPLCALAVAWTVAGVLNGYMRERLGHWPPAAWAAAELAKFVLGTIVTAILAVTLAWLLDALGLDPRGPVVGAYVQRNSLVVGFVMGFAIIPIIYTIADDALSTVPAHLRSASLACGATPWQTAVRVIVPTAASGLFSALMIGLGRAVGETMIVLMAAGNTSIMEWNVFNGFQTLSALIATELAEAVRNSSHYRTLFLAALTLFAITFVINTLAESVRLRFRRRAYEL